MNRERLTRQDAWALTGLVLLGAALAYRNGALALLGAGLLAAAPATSLGAAAPAFAAAAVGAGLVTAPGFAYFARLVPVGEAGRYSGVFFLGRAAAAGRALPIAGPPIALSGT